VQTFLPFSTKLAKLFCTQVIPRKKKKSQQAADNQIIFDTSELLKKTSNTLKVAFQKYPNLKVYLSVEIDC